MTASLGSIGPGVLATCLATLRKVLARVQPAWNVWDVAEKLNKSRQEAAEAADVAREATESLPGSPFHVTLKEEAEDLKKQLSKKNIMAKLLSSDFFISFSMMSSNISLLGV